jgi:hypothetical protein
LEDCIFQVRVLVRHTKKQTQIQQIQRIPQIKKSTRLCCTQRRRVLFHARLGKFQKLTKSIAASERILFLQKEKDV